MTPPDWPAGIDYDETIRLVSRTIRQHYDRTTWGNEAASGVAAEAVDAIARLIAKAVEEAEADAERLANNGNHLWCAIKVQPPVGCDCGWVDALAAHEARKAGR